MRNIFLKLYKGKYYSSKTFVSYLRKSGLIVGERTTFFSPKSNVIDLTRPYLIKIGNDVKITHGVSILTHGYDFSVLRNLYHETLGSSGAVTIGNNVFIGLNTTILKNVIIGNNVIIGANTLVNKNLDSNSVYGGNPVKFIMSIEDYFLKRKNEYINEARNLVLSYISRYNVDPPISEFKEFFPLFLERSIEVVKKNSFDFSSNMATPDLFYTNFMNSKKIFQSYQDFIDWCKS